MNSKINSNIYENDLKNNSHNILNMNFENICSEVLKNYFKIISNKKLDMDTRNI